MSDFTKVLTTSSDREISISQLIRTSYEFFSAHFGHFLKLASIPIIIWVTIELFRDYLFYEHGVVYSSKIANSLAAGAFVLLWYRKFLLGDTYATYDKIIDHVISPGVFNLLNLFKYIVRLVIMTAILIVPALLIAVSMLFYYASQGINVDAQLLNELILNSTFLAILFFSPIMVRLSFYGIAIALGRQKMEYREVWHKTKGYTWELWHLLLRAVLPVGLYNYYLTNALQKISYQAEINYFWASLFVNIPAAFLTFMMLAIVVGANGGAFKQLFGIRTAARP